MITVSDIRKELTDKYEREEFVIDKTGDKVVEILGASFLADEDHIFGMPNIDYIERELEWYQSQSLNINDIYGSEREPPKAWKYAADDYGNINSNYGYLIWSRQNFDQYNNVLNELKNNPYSRRAIMIYTRPSIWNEFNFSGKSDFICTNTVSYYIRNNMLITNVQMRSNDCWAGYRNDFAWQQKVSNELCKDLNIKMGDIIWQVQNLHCYEKDFYLLEAYIKGHTQITKKEYNELNS